MKKFFTKFVLGTFALLLAAISINAQEEVYYEETFTGGLGDWTTVGVSNGNPLWEWDAEGDAATGSFWGGAGIGSPTGSTGAAVFNSDFYDNGGLGVANIGMGPIPAPHNSELISPVIDMTGIDKATLEFYQYHRNFQSTNSVQYTTDGGMTWTDAVEVNGDILTNFSTARDAKALFALDLNGGSDQVQIKFTFDGDYYFWIIDDVRVLRTDNEIAVGAYNFYPVSSFATPSVMLSTDSFGFRAEVINYSVTDQTNVKINAEVVSATSGTAIHSQTVDVATWAAGARDTVVFDDLYAPENLAVGNYFIRYTIEGDNSAVDYDTDNNQWLMPFRVTETKFAKTDGIRNGAGVRPGGDYTMGNLYTTASDLVGDYFAQSLDFSVDAQGSLAGLTLNAYLMEVDDVEAGLGWENFDNNASPLENPALILKGFNTIDLTGNAANRYINTSLTDFDGATEIPLKPGTRYVALIEFNGAANALDMSVNYDIDYNFISSILYSADDGRFYLGGFGNRNAAVVEMNITMPTNTNETTLPESSLTIFPNPVKDQLNVEVNLENKSEMINITLADMSGKVLMIDAIEDVAQLTKSYNLTDYAAGTYFLRLSTAEGFKTIKVMKQ